MEFCCLHCLCIVWSDKPTVCCVYACGCNRIDQTSRVGMHSLLASPIWKQLGYAEKVKMTRSFYVFWIWFSITWPMQSCIPGNTGYSQTPPQRVVRRFACHWIIGLHLGGETKLVSPAIRETLMLYVVRQPGDILLLHSLHDKSS